MTCEQIECSAHVFSSCQSHCERKFCLEHLIEHDDEIFHEYQSRLNQLDKSNDNLFYQVNQINTKVNQDLLLLLRFLIKSSSFEDSSTSRL